MQKKYQETLKGGYDQLWLVKTYFTTKHIFVYYTSEYFLNISCIH